MELTSEIKVIDCALYLKSDNVLIISDLHIGIEEMMHKKGILIPTTHSTDIKKKLRQIFNTCKELNYNIDKIIINGDLKHEFGTISNTEWRNTLQVLDLIQENCNEIILIKGNHDTILDPIAKKRNLTVTKGISFDNIHICHGDKIPTKNDDTFNDYLKAKTIIIGHEHTAIRLKSGVRSELYKCFIVGDVRLGLRDKLAKKTIIAMPSFNPMIEGTDILEDKKLSPFLKGNLNSFRVIVVGDKVYDFGKIKELRKEI